MKKASGAPAKAGTAELSSSSHSPPRLPLPPTTPQPQARKLFSPARAAPDAVGGISPRQKGASSAKFGPSLFSLAEPPSLVDSLARASASDSSDGGSDPAAPGLPAPPSAVLAALKVHAAPAPDAPAPDARAPRALSVAHAVRNLLFFMPTDKALEEARNEIAEAITFMFNNPEKRREDALAAILKHRHVTGRNVTALQDLKHADFSRSAAERQQFLREALRSALTGTTDCGPPPTDVRAAFPCIKRWRSLGSMLLKPPNNDDSLCASASDHAFFACSISTSKLLSAFVRLYAAPGPAVDALCATYADAAWPKWGTRSSGCAVDKPLLKLRDPRDEVFAPDEDEANDYAHADDGLRFRARSRHARFLRAAIEHRLFWLDRGPFVEIDMPVATTKDLAHAAEALSDFKRALEPISASSLSAPALGSDSTSAHVSVPVPAPAHVLAPAAAAAGAANCDAAGAGRSGLLLSDLEAIGPIRRTRNWSSPLEFLGNLSSGSDSAAPVPTTSVFTISGPLCSGKTHTAVRISATANICLYDSLITQPDKRTDRGLVNWLADELSLLAVPDDYSVAVVLDDCSSDSFTFLRYVAVHHAAIFSDVLARLPPRRARPSHMTFVLVGVDCTLSSVGCNSHGFEIVLGDDYAEKYAADPACAAEVRALKLRSPSTPLELFEGRAGLLRELLSRAAEFPGEDSAAPDPAAPAASANSADSAAAPAAPALPSSSSTSSRALARMSRIYARSLAGAGPLAGTGGGRLDAEALLAVAGGQALCGGQLFSLQDKYKSMLQELDFARRDSAARSVTPLSLIGLSYWTLLPNNALGGVPSAAGIAADAAGFVVPSANEVAACARGTDRDQPAVSFFRALLRLLSAYPSDALRGPDKVGAGDVAKETPSPGASCAKGAPSGASCADVPVDAAAAAVCGDASRPDGEPRTPTSAESGAAAATCDSQTFGSDFSALRAIASRCLAARKDVAWPTLTKDAAPCYPQFEPGDGHRHGNRGNDWDYIDPTPSLYCVGACKDHMSEAKRAGAFALDRGESVALVVELAPADPARIWLTTFLERIVVSWCGVATFVIYCVPSKTFSANTIVSALTYDGFLRPHGDSVRVPAINELLKLHKVKEFTPVVWVTGPYSDNATSQCNELRKLVQQLRTPSAVTGAGTDCDGARPEWDRSLVILHERECLPDVPSRALSVPVSAPAAESMTACAATSAAYVAAPRAVCSATAAMASSAAAGVQQPSMTQPHSPAQSHPTAQQRPAAAPLSLPPSSARGAQHGGPDPEPTPNSMNVVQLGRCAAVNELAVATAHVPASPQAATASQAQPAVLAQDSSEDDTYSDAPDSEDGANSSVIPVEGSPDILVEGEIDHDSDDSKDGHVRDGSLGALIELRAQVRELAAGMKAMEAQAKAQESRFMAQADASAAALKAQEDRFTALLKLVEQLSRKDQLE